MKNPFFRYFLKIMYYYLIFFFLIFFNRRIFFGLESDSKTTSMIENDRYNIAVTLVYRSTYPEKKKVSHSAFSLDFLLLDGIP